MHQPSNHCILPQNSPNSQKPLAEISSHGCHRCSQIFLTEIFSHGLHRTHRILAPSMCNCRRVWHPCHTNAPSQEVQWSPLHQPSSHCILPQNSQNPQKPLAEIFSHGLHRTRRILVHPVCAIIGGYGIPAIPTHPPNYLPTEPTESTEVYDARYSPTDCTDVHRLGGYGIPAIPTQLPNYLPTEAYAA